MSHHLLTSIANAISDEAERCQLWECAMHARLRKRHDAVRPVAELGADLTAVEPQDGDAPVDEDEKKKRLKQYLLLAMMVAR